MLLPIAQMVMRGRSQALLFVLFAALSSEFFWPNGILAAATINLVMLRIGTKEGALLWLWAMLPATALVFYFQSSIPPLLLTTSLIASWVLRVSTSWQFALITVAVCSLASGLILELFANPVLNVYASQLEQVLTSWKDQLAANPEAQAAINTEVKTVLIAGYFGTLITIGSLLGLVLARSWQAKLYNPGGFQREFHQLRLDKQTVIVLLLLAMVFISLGSQYRAWIWICLSPMLVASIGLFHAYALQKKLGTYWYVLFYFVLVTLWEPVSYLLAGLAIVDSFRNFRQSFPGKQTD